MPTFRPGHVTDLLDGDIE